MTGIIIKTVDQMVEEIIEGTINCWKIKAEENCDLKWQLKNMVSRCFEQLARDITDERKAQAFMQADRQVRFSGIKEYEDGREIISLNYTCLFGNVHRVAAKSLTELNHRLQNDQCKCNLNSV